MEKVSLNDNSFNKKESVLKKRKIERDSEGKLVFYHVTTVDKFVKIIKSGKILPPVESGEINWSSEEERDDKVKMSKIYIGSRDFVEKNGPANGVVYEKGGRYFLLEVHVDESKLKPDEDTGADNWLDSLDFLGSCSHMGEISNFKLVSVGKLKLPTSLTSYIYKEPRTDEEKKEIILKETEKILENENKMLEEAGIDISDLKQ